MLAEARDIGNHVLSIETGYDFEEWTSEDGSCAILLWNNDPPPLSENETAIVSIGGDAFVFSGYWYSDRFETDEELASTLFIAPDPKEIISQHVFGAYVICIYLKRAKKVLFYNTVSCQPVLFYRDTDNIFMASTRGMSIPLLLDGDRRQIEYEPSSFVSFVQTGYFCDDYIAYKNVSLLDSNSELKANDNSTQVVPIDATMENLGLGENELSDEILDRFCDLTVRLVKKVSRSDCEIGIGLSGGRDSRMVVSALTAAGVNFSASTNGWSDSPDVIIASRICKTLNVEHSVHISDEDSRDVINVTPLNAFRRQMFVMDCLYFYPMVYPQNSPVIERKLKTSGERPKQIQFTGTGAEMLRGGVGIRSRPPLRDIDEVTPTFVEDFVRKQWLGDLTSINNPHATRYHEWVEGWIDSYCRGKNVDGILERLYLHNWAGRGRGAITQHLSSKAGAVVNLMTDSGLFKIAHQLKAHYRYNEILFYEVIKRLAPTIADIPLNDHRWAFELKGPRPEDEEGYNRRRPIIGVRTGRSPSRTYFSSGVDLRELFQEQLFRNKSSEKIYDVINRKWLEKLFSTHHIYETYNSYSAWRILGLSELVTNRWLSPAPIHEAPIPVRHGSRWDSVALECCTAVSTATAIDESGAVASVAEHKEDIWRTLAKEYKSELHLAATYKDNPGDVFVDLFESPEPTIEERCRPVGLFSDFRLDKGSSTDTVFVIETADFSEKGRWIAISLESQKALEAMVFEFEIEISSSVPFTGYVYLQSKDKSGKSVTLAQTGLVVSSKREKVRLIGPIIGNDPELWVPVLRDEGTIILHNIRLASLGSINTFFAREENAADSAINRIRRGLRLALNDIKTRYQVPNDQFIDLQKSVKLHELHCMTLFDFLENDNPSEINLENISVQEVAKAIQNGIFSHFNVDKAYWETSKNS